MPTPPTAHGERRPARLGGSPSSQTRDPDKTRIRTMDTTAIRSKIKAGEAQPKHDHSGMTRLLVAIPVDLRTGLAELSAETGVSQQEIIRQAIRRLWEDGPSAIQAN